MDKKAKIATITALVIVLSVVALMVYAAPKKCNNGVDDDNDGLVDYPNDPGCSSTSDNTETGTAICDNGVDETNDRDTLADFRLSGGDPGCTSATDMSEVDGQCDDLSDNDGDGLNDYPSDTGCASFSDSSEYGTAQCDDGVDNDGDTKTDFSTFNYLQDRDSKCSSSADNDESPKDSCTDTDGGQVSGTQGTVSGDDESVPYSLTDFCVDTTTLTEYYCGTKVQDYAPLNININCAGNQTNSCVNGACV